MNKVGGRPGVHKPPGPISSQDIQSWQTRKSRNGDDGMEIMGRVEQGQNEIYRRNFLQGGGCAFGKQAG